MTNNPRLDLYGYIGEGEITAADFIAQLRALGDVTAIDLHISSGGGDVDMGHAIYNALDQHPATITAYIDGMAASMASVIAMVADRIVIASNATWMMHNPSGIAVGGMRDMEAARKRLEIMTTAIVAAYMRHTAADESQVRQWMDAETWMDATEAVTAGFAHEIGPGSAMAASVDLSRFDNIPGRIAAIHATVPANAQNAKPEVIPMADDTPVINDGNDPQAPNHEARIAELTAELESLKAAQGEAVTAAAASAVTAERQRIADVQALTYPGAEDVIKECIAGGVSKAEAAVKLVAFQQARTSQALAKLEADAPPVVTDDGTGDAPAKSDPLDMDEAGQRAHFAATASLHDDYINADYYVRHCAAEAKRREVK